MSKLTTVIVPLQELARDVEFYRGTRFRQYEAGMNGVAKEDDYYEYMLVYDGYAATYMMLVNVSSEAGRSKAGRVACEVKMLTNMNKAVVTVEAIIYSMGSEQMFLVQEV